MNNEGEGVREDAEIRKTTVRRNRKVGAHSLKPPGCAIAYGIAQVLVQVEHKYAKQLVFN